MQDRIKELSVGVAASLLASFMWQIGIVLLGPLSFLAIVAWVVPSTGLALGPETTFGVTLGWTLSGIIAVIWFRNHSKARLKRTLDLMSLMFGSDEKFAALVHANPMLLTEADIKLMATQMLSGMCEILAYRVKFDEKAATFLVLKNEAANSGFNLFAKHRHPDLAASEIEHLLTRQRGLAGRALMTRRVEIMRDCRKPPRNMEWFPTTVPPLQPRFSGRAAVVVQAIVGGEYKEIGVLCFDVRRPWRLSEEDQHIMGVFSMKLANLWTLCNHP